MWQDSGGKVILQIDTREEGDQPWICIWVIQFPVRIFHLHLPKLFSRWESLERNAQLQPHHRSLLASSNTEWSTLVLYLWCIIQSVVGELCPYSYPQLISAVCSYFKRNWDKSKLILQLASDFSPSASVCLDIRLLRKMFTHRGPKALGFPAVTSTLFQM